MESICGSRYWDTCLSWHGQSPDFTQCFQETALIWTPCAILWLFMPNEILRIRRLNAAAHRDSNGRRKRVPWTPISILKLTLSVLLVTLSLCQLSAALIRVVSGNQEIDQVHPVQWISPSVQLATFTLATALIWLHRSYAIQSSGVLFIFWFVYSLFSLFSYYSILKHLNDPESSLWHLPRVEYLTRLILIPVILLQWILSCVNDSLPYDFVNPNHQYLLPSPELTASFPSLLTFYWTNPLIYLGYTRPLKLGDLYDILPVLKTAHVFRGFHKYYKPSKSSSIVWPLFQSLSHDFMVAALFKLMSCFLMFVNPLVLDYLLKWMESREPYWLGFAYVGVMLLASIFDSMLLNQHEYRVSLISLKMKSALTSAIYQKALRLSVEEKCKYSTGEIVNLMSVDAQRVDEFMHFANDSWSAPLIISICIFLLWQQLGVATLAGIVVILLLFPFNGWITAVFRRAQQALMKEKDKRSKLLNEVFSGMKVIKLYGWEPTFKSRIEKARQAECVNLKKQSLYMSVVTFTLSSSPIFVAVATFITYSLLDSKNILDPSKAFVSLTLFNMLRIPMTFLPLFVTFATLFFVSMRRIEKYLMSGEGDHKAITYSTINSLERRSTTPSIGSYASQEKLPAEFKSNALHIEDANFAWSSTANTMNATLQNINLSIAKGSLVAIVGTVGSGKSSLLSAILNDMVKLTGSGQVKGTLAYVPQQAWIQNATVRQNIIFTSKYIESKYKKIVESSALDSDIKILSAGDDTEIGERGINLSGGQKQRVSLARAVYSEADIYLLDDPLSAVDTHVGKHIFEKVIGPNGLLKKKTRLLVTHKVTLLPEVDFIIVMKDGKISESGSYHELLDKKGAFSEFLVEYLAEDVDEASESDEKIIEMREKMKPELERHISRASGAESDSDARSQQGRGLSSSSSLVKRSRHGTVSSRNTADKNVSSKRQSIAPAYRGGKTDPAQGRLIEAEVEAIGSVTYSTYLAYLRAMGFLTVFTVLAFMVINSTFNISSSIWLSFWADDALYPDRANDTTLRTTRVVVYGLLGASESATQFVANFLSFLATLRASSYLHDMMLDRIMKSPMSFFDTTPQGRLLNRFTKDVDSIDTSIRLNIRQFLNSLFRCLITVIVISLESPIFLLFIIPLSAIYHFIQKYYIATSRQLKRIESTSRSPIYSHFSETVTGSTCIRAFGVTDLFIRECETRTDTNAKSFILAAAAARWLGVRLEFIGTLIVVIAALLGVTGIGAVNPALAGLSISYALQMTQMLNMLVRSSTDLENNLVSAERIIEYTRLQKEADWFIDSTKPKPGWPDQGAITLDNYSTRYREGLDLVLRRVSFESKAAEKIGLVGRTGAGKSSITLAMFRLIEPVNGSIIVDGVDISRIGLMDLRSRITIIPQDPILFTGSLRMNLDPFDKHTDNELWHAIELSHLRDFVNSLEAGLSSRVTEGGENMSVGQRQLVCLARALLRKSKILILDEATAAVDLETDDLIQKTIRKEFADCTILTIAHRLNTIIDYDRILLLEDGEVAEFDTPKALLADPESKFYSMAKSAGLVTNGNGSSSTPPETSGTQE